DDLGRAFQNLRTSCRRIDLWGRPIATCQRPEDETRECARLENALKAIFADAVGVHLRRSPFLGSPIDTCGRVGHWLAGHWPGSRASCPAARVAKSRRNRPQGQDEQAPGDGIGPLAGSL